MHIGILKVDTPPLPLLVQHGEYSDMMIRMLDRTDGGFSYTILNVENETLPNNLDDYDGFIITGSKVSVYDDVIWIEKLKALLVEASHKNKKLVGICFGHQLLAATFGGLVEKSTRGWGLGVASFDVYSHKLWQQPTQKKISLLTSHKDQVVRLPSGAQCIAGNEFCPNACFQLRDNILGIQEHPEFSPAYLRALMNIRRETIGEYIVNKAEQSLLRPNNGLVVGGWIRHFLNPF
ncbi:MAG: hypothetical protein JKY01_00705 [Pseudomonadales bacterium]|nr:hypothetical protein [Pseudomonadales bacterium]